ncbi:MAG: 2-hydroxychromene-2-carboxylate isomerase [Rubrivivax sp.]
MPATPIDYYLTPVSPWAYLGHERFVAMVERSGSAVNVRPADFGAIFTASGGLPLGKRAPQRQAYRLVELKRFSDHLGVSLHPQPAHFPVPGDAAARLVVAVRDQLGARPALDLCGRIGRAIWAEQRNLADPDVLRVLMAEASLDADLIDTSDAPAISQALATCTQQALDAGVFGAPSYVIDGEVFWGQDRLDFVERRLARS